jgi:hypothetical protein
LRDVASQRYVISQDTSGERRDAVFEGHPCTAEGVRDADHIPVWQVNVEFSDEWLKTKTTDDLRARTGGEELRDVVSAAGRW